MTALKETYKISFEGNLRVVEDFINATKNKRYTIDKITKEIIAEDDHWGGYDTGQRIMTIYYKEV